MTCFVNGFHMCVYTSLCLYSIEKKKKYNLFLTDLCLSPLLFKSNYCSILTVHSLQIYICQPSRKRVDGGRVRSQIATVVLPIVITEGDQRRRSQTALDIVFLSSGLFLWYSYQIIQVDIGLCSEHHQSFRAACFINSSHDTAQLTSFCSKTLLEIKRISNKSHVITITYLYSAGI